MITNDFLSGSHGTVNTDREEAPSLFPYRDNQFEVRSSVSVTTNSSENKKYKKEKKKSKSRNFRGLFNSDCEDEVQSVVSDNPQLYQRSISTVSYLLFYWSVSFWSFQSNIYKRTFMKPIFVNQIFIFCLTVFLAKTHNLLMSGVFEGAT